MAYRLLVLDLDGTLTNSRKEITPHTLETLIHAQERGIKIVLASGRPTYGVAPVADKLRLTDFGGYILSYNGGEIVDWKSKEMLYENVLEPEVLPYLYECAQKNNFAIVTYHNEFVITEYPDDEYVQKEALLNVMQLKKVEHFLDAIQFPVVKCMIVGDPARLVRLEKEMFDYLIDMVIAQYYAKINRETMLQIIKNVLNIKIEDTFSSVHNFIDFEDFIIRKGAIRSYENEKMIIPFNMRDGILVCEGKSNEDWNCSAPHGAGRVLSRAQARNQLDMKEFVDSMKGIYSSSVCKNTLDESPMAYKNPNKIEELGYDLYDVEYAKEGKNYYLRIFIDKPEGIDLTDCEKVNDAINTLLDDANYIKEQYFLEVSSPGIERVLRKDKHLEQNKGKEIRINLFKKAQNGNKEYQGILKDFNDAQIIIEIEDEKIEIDRKNISLIKTVYDWG